MLGERLLHREKSYLITELKIIQLSVSWGCGYLKIVPCGGGGGLKVCFAGKFRRPLLLIWSKFKIPGHFIYVCRCTFKNDNIIIMHLSSASSTGGGTLG